MVFLQMSEPMKNYDGEFEPIQSLQVSLALDYPGIHWLVSDLDGVPM